MTGVQCNLIKMHLTSDLSPEISYEVGKLEISKETEMLYYELMRALEEEETVSNVRIRP